MHHFLPFNMIHDHRSTCTLVLCSLNGSTYISNYFYMHILNISCIFRFFLLLPSHCLQVSNSTDMSIIVWRTGTGERLSTISAVRDMPRLGPWRNVLGWPVAGVPWHQLRRDGWGLPWGFSGKTICTVYRYIYMIYIYIILIYICNILRCKWCEQFLFFK